MQLPVPTGRIVPAVYGYNLVLPRSLPVDLDDAWAHITTAGEIGPGWGDDPTQQEYFQAQVR